MKTHPADDKHEEAAQSNEPCEHCTGPVDLTIDYNLFKTPHNYDLFAPMKQQAIKHDNHYLDNLRNASLPISKRVYDDVFHKHPENAEYNSEMLCSVFASLAQVLRMNVDDVLYIHDVRCIQTGEKVMLERFFAVVNTYSSAFVNGKPTVKYVIMKLAD